MKNFENKMIAIDEKNENVFFFEFLPYTGKVFVEFSTDEELFEQFKSYSFNQTPEQTKPWKQVTKEELPKVLMFCDKYLDKYVKSTPYTHVQESMMMSFTVLYDALFEEVTKQEEKNGKKLCIN